MDLSKTHFAATPRSANEWPPLRATQRIRRLEPDGEAVASVSRIPRGRTISALTSRHNHGGADHRSWSRQSRSNLMKLVSRAGRHSGWPLFSLPTHREVVAAAFRISALGARYFKSPPAPVRSMLRVCIPRRRDTEAVLYERRDTHKNGIGAKRGFAQFQLAEQIATSSRIFISGWFAGTRASGAM